jgi:hypothetical protein
MRGSAEKHWQSNVMDSFGASHTACAPVALKKYATFAA